MLDPHADGERLGLEREPGARGERVDVARAVPGREHDAAAAISLAARAAAPPSTRSHRRTTSSVDARLEAHLDAGAAPSVSRSAVTIFGRRFEPTCGRASTRMSGSAPCATRHSSTAATGPRFCERV